MPFGLSSGAPPGEAAPAADGPAGAAPPPGASAPYFFSAIQPALSPEKAKRWILSILVSVPSARFRIATLFCTGLRCFFNCAASFLVGATLKATHFESSEMASEPGVVRVSPTPKRRTVSPCVSRTTTSLSPSSGDSR